MTDKNSKKKLSVSSLLSVFLSSVVVFSWLLFTVSSNSTEATGKKQEPNCKQTEPIRKEGGQETYEWVCVHKDKEDRIILIAQSDNIKQCFTCFLKKFSDWTWEQEVRKGIREDPKYITCRRYKRKKARNGQEVCLYKGANDTYSLVVEGHCPIEYQCKYEPGGQEPNIDSVIDSLNDNFK
jgi:hypothetical protein